MRDLKTEVVDPVLCYEPHQSKNSSKFILFTMFTFGRQSLRKSF